MTDSATYVVATLGVAAHIATQIAIILRTLLRRRRQPSSRIAWVLIVVAFPIVGILSYVLFGEINIGRRRIAIAREVLAKLPRLPAPRGADGELLTADIPVRYAHLFELGRTVSGFEPVGGNSALLPADSNRVIDAMVADIDAAEHHVHLLFYIWLPDRNGGRVAAALIRAAGRGVTCRAMADDLGSRRMIRSPHWQAMEKAGVQLACALPIGNALIRSLLRPLYGRIDVRNHRKIVVIDNRITYCGSQNCADPEFRIKADYAPWVDAMLRFVGPVARQNQHLFAANWMVQHGDDIAALLTEPYSDATPGFPAQVIGTGPTVRDSAMPEVFESLIHAARRELVITTPYFVPDEPMQAALCASARRGVATTIIVPARNDSRIVAAASHSYYEELLEAGVKVFEYTGGLLHTKSLTLDGEVTLIGSANMDRRSFELNYENNILFVDQAMTLAMRQRQDSYLAESKRVDPAEVAAWSWRRRLWNNTVATLGPVL